MTGLFYGIRGLLRSMIFEIIGSMVRVRDVEEESKEWM
jgi:hypothetical protein